MHLSVRDHALVEQEGDFLTVRKSIPSVLCAKKLLFEKKRLFSQKKSAPLGPDETKITVPIVPGARTSQWQQWNMPHGSQIKYAHYPTTSLHDKLSAQGRGVAAGSTDPAEDRLLLELRGDTSADVYRLLEEA